MTTKVNGAVYPGLFVEKNVAFIKITFSTDISAIAAGNLYLNGTTTTVTGSAVADSTFAIVESALVQALKTLETGSTVLGISKYDSGTTSVDVLVGHSQSWFSDQNGIIASTLPVTGAKAVITTAGTNTALGDLVAVNDTAVTFNLRFGALLGTLPIGTLANGTLANGPGATSGANPVNSPTGTQGYHPVSSYLS